MNKSERIHLYSRVIDIKRPDEVLYVTSINMRDITLKWDLESGSYIKVPRKTFDEQDTFKLLVDCNPFPSQQEDSDNG